MVPEYPVSQRSQGCGNRSADTGCACRGDAQGPAPWAGRNGNTSTGCFLDCARRIRENGVPACHCLAGHVDHRTCCSPSDLSGHEWDIPELQATCPVRTEGLFLRKPSRGSAARARTPGTACLHLHTLKSLDGTGLRQVTAWLSAVQTPPCSGEAD